MSWKFTSARLRQAVAALVLAGSMRAWAAGALDLAKTRGATDARRMVEWVLRSADHQGRPFAVVDKRQARIYVFGADGRLAGESAVLLGAAPGDHSMPGVGARTQSGTLRPDDLTTPAGRFDAKPGRNISGEHVVWADYDAAFAIHRNRPGRAQAARDRRLASETVADNRVSNGCVVVPVAFYEKVVAPVLGKVRSVVYVLPESRSGETFFEALQQL